ncbi:MAG: hypothetical protein HC819_19895 [Cyclobacteriaceae bacterium]|nr:hypothetical protein [Cyclobacteriaceae bacterium]
MVTVLLGIGILAIFFILMSVRLLFLKGGQFKGTCASQSPFLNNDGGKCSYCGRDAGEQCKKEKAKSEVEKVLSKFQ